MMKIEEFVKFIASLKPNKARFLLNLQDGKSVKEAATCVGISIQSAYNWRARDEKYNEAWLYVENQKISKLESSVIGFLDRFETLTSEAPSTAKIFFPYIKLMLQAHRRARYGEHTTIETVDQKEIVMSEDLPDFEENETV